MVNTASVGAYIINYTALDKAGNTATKTRIVNVILKTPTNTGLQKRNLKDTPTSNRFVRPLDKVWPAHYV